MPTVFYDLETSDRLFCGQIINYAFLEVGPDFEIRSECCGRMRLSRLQLPSAAAILKNRTDICVHQLTAEQSEKEGLLAIWNYLADLVRLSGKPVQLIGFNSSKFDLPFLRTSLIRNGLNPYFGGKLLPGDMLHAARKLAVTKEDFPRKPAEGSETGRISYALENLCHQFGLLSGAQTHESRGDVVLTIELAKAFKKRFGLDVRSFGAYEIPPSVRRGEIVLAAAPTYDPASQRAYETTPYALLDTDYRSALWVNLANYREGRGRGSVQWFGRSSSAFFLSPGEETPPADLGLLAEKALAEFKELTVRNFFPRSVCDIEIDIYRLDFDAIEALRQAIWERDRRSLKALANADAEAVYQRHALANYVWGNGKDPQVESLLREYAIYRYGGRMHVAKSSSTQEYKEGEVCEDYHETYVELIGQLDGDLAKATGEDLVLLASLRRYYLESDIRRVAGGELDTIRRLPREQASTVRAVG